MYRYGHIGLLSAQKSLQNSKRLLHPKSLRSTIKRQITNRKSLRTMESMNAEAEEATNTSLFYS